MEGRCAFKEGQGIVAQIHDLEVKVGTRGGDAMDPPGGLLPKSVLPSGTDDNSDPGLGHYGLRDVGISKKLTL
jgi:hypothetical protein